MKIYGLIGQTLTHSFSARYFTQKFKKENITHCQYKLFPIQNLNTLDAFIRDNPDLCGFNVTFPFKQTIIPFLHQLDDTAEEIKAVNTVLIHRNNEEFWLKGFNTDGIGFRNSLEIPKSIQKALILGTGGAARAVAWSLASLGIGHLFVSRNKTGLNVIRYEELKPEHFRQFRLIINATPAGMFPNVHTAPPIPYSFLHSENIMYDLVYNPSITRFMHHGMEKGAKVFNGLKMLTLQADESWEIWKSIDYGDI